jgi:hypothetical protein
MTASFVCHSAAIAATAALLFAPPASAQQGPPGCNWNKYLYAQDATQQGKIDINLLNQMSAMASAQGYSLTNKVWQLCNGWLNGGQARQRLAGHSLCRPKDADLDRRRFQQIVRPASRSQLTFIF